MTKRPATHGQQHADTVTAIATQMADAIIDRAAQSGVEITPQQAVRMYQNLADVAGQLVRHVTTHGTADGISFTLADAATGQPQPEGTTMTSPSQRHPERAAERAALQRAAEDDVLAAARDLDPADLSLEARQIRQTAESIQDHREMETLREQYLQAQRDQHAESVRTIEQAPARSRDDDGPALTR